MIDFGQDDKGRGVQHPPFSHGWLLALGVPVIGYQTDRLPAFFCRSSEYDIDFRLDKPEEIALFMKSKWDMKLQGGLVVANPIPEEFAMPESVIQQEIDFALQEAKDAGIKGKETTPFLLQKITELTEGNSLKANIELVLNNARLGSAIAIELSALSSV